MEVKSEDICIILDFRLTERQVFDGQEMVDTYFNIRDYLGQVYGKNFSNIEEPLKLLFSLQSEVNHQ